jgi:hypothetical protein
VCRAQPGGDGVRLVQLVTVDPGLVLP